ncbi:hypothetical protein VJI72_08120, partial [Parvimonas micra]|nr:hypothetical protein [Parvimonas micra]
MGAATSITEAGNDGYVISGYERRNLGDELNPLLVRTDRNGMELARTSIPIPGNQFVYDAFPAGGTEPDVILVGSTDGNSKA